MFVTGASLRLFEHPLWIEFFQKIRPAFTVPNRKLISNGLLDNEYEKMESEISKKLFDAPDLHFQFDGWSNCRNESIINCVISHPAPLFVDFIETKANSHNAEYLYNTMKDIMVKYNINKFFVVIGDNAGNVQAALTLLTTQYPHIVSLGCVSHLMHLLCCDIMKGKAAKKIGDDANRIIKKVKKSHLLNALFTAIQKEKKIEVVLKVAGKTRWGLVLASFQSLAANRNVLQIMVVDDSVKDKITSAMRLQISDDNFWKKIDCMINVLQPVIAANIELEGDGVLIHKVHEHCNKMKNGITQALRSGNMFTIREKNNILNRLDIRIKQVVKPIHLAAAILHPTSRGTELTAQESIDAMEFIFKVATDMSLDPTIVLSETGSYKNKEGLWNKEFVWTTAKNMCPLNWWKTFYSSTSLSKLAVRILSAPTSSAATERTNSTFGWIHSNKRNRLHTKRAGKITYLAHNWKLLHLQKTKTKRSYDGTARASTSTQIDSDSEDSSLESGAISSESSNESDDSDETMNNADN